MIALFIICGAICWLFAFCLGSGPVMLCLTFAGGICFMVASFNEILLEDRIEKLEKEVEELKGKKK